MVKLVTNGALRWRWYWVTEILEQDPMPVLRATLVEMHTQGSGPKAGYCPSKKNQDFFSTLAHWGWRRKPEMMLQLVEEMTHKGTTGSGGQYVSKGRGKGMVLMKGAGRGRGRGAGGGDKDALPGVDQVIRLGGEIMSTHSTRHALTVNKKIALLMKIWAVLPQGHKKASVAQRFADLLPSFASDDHRQNEITNLINAFWTILSDVGRSDRQELLVGPLVATGGPNSEKKPTGCTEFLKLFTRRLPPPLAVEQFFKVLGEFEAGTPAYKFIQSDICKSSNGRHDELMKSVFKKYLLKEDEGPVKAAEMFKVLLADARSRDVIQTSFDTLTEHLEGYSEIGLLQTVVQKMGSLEKQSRQKGTREITPEASLPVPIDWLQFLKLQEEAVPHVQFLLMVLHTGIGESELLGSMITKFGKIFFWDCLGHVLSAAQGKLVEQAIPAPVLGVLQGLNVKVMEEADKKAKAVTGVAASGKKRAKGSFGVGSAIFGLDGTKWGSVVADEGRAWKLDSGRIAKKETEGDKWTWAGGVSTKGDEGACKYFQTVADMKKKANVKDPSARLSGYSDLMTLAQKEKDAGKAFEDLLPFLLSRFNAEQEQGRSHILSELFVGKKLPDDLWEDKLEHLRSFWKVSSKARESSSYQCTWNKCGRQLVENALKNWGKPIKDGEEAPPYPTEACLFGLEVVSEIDLPELLVKNHSKIETLKDLENATRWVLETAVPLSGEQSAPLEDFWKALKTMSTIKFCGEDPDAITSWRTEKSVKAHKEKSSTSPEVSVMEPGSVVRGVQRGNWLELINGQGFMLITSEKTGLPIMKQDSGNTGEKGLWETYPFVSEWWRKLLAGGVKQKAIDFVFVGVVNLLADRQQHFVAGDKKLSKRWWAPVECEEYKDAVTNILQHIESGVIPSKEGSAMITRRITALKNINIMTDLKWKVLATKRRERVEDRTQIQSSVGQALSQLPFRHLPATKWVEGESWDIQKHHKYTPLPWQTGRCKDSIAAQELDTINKLLQRPNRRQVLWQISEIAAMLSGPKITQLVEANFRSKDEGWQKKKDAENAEEEEDEEQLQKGYVVVHAFERAAQQLKASPAEHVRELFRIADMVKPLVWCAMGAEADLPSPREAPREPEPEEPAARARQAEALKCFAREKLLRAADDGSLGRALHETKALWKEEFFELRQEAASAELELKEWMSLRPRALQRELEPPRSEELYSGLGDIRQRVRGLNSAHVGARARVEADISAFKAQQSRDFEALALQEGQLEDALQHLDRRFDAWERGAQESSPSRGRCKTPDQEAGRGGREEASKPEELAQLKAELQRLEAEVAGGTGKWPPHKHEVFMRILRIFRMQATEQCYSRLEQQFPDVSQADLAEHLRFCTQQEAHQARRRLLLARWRQRKVLLERQKAKEVPCDQKEPLVQEEEKQRAQAQRQKVQEWRLARDEQERLREEAERRLLEAKEAREEKKRRRHQKQVKEFAEARRKLCEEKRRQAELSEAPKPKRELSEEDKHRIIRRNMEMLTRKLQVPRECPKAPRRTTAYDHVPSRLYETTECFVQKTGPKEEPVD
ncbi:unnamed protein product [Effrenium voratum]|nr:unnamed protein product [Effrenium voratum]